MSDADGMIVVTAGDPAGIGAEVVVKALDALPSAQRRHIEIVGTHDVLQAALSAAGIAGMDFVDANGPPRTSGTEIRLHHVPIEGDRIRLGEVDPRAGDAAFRYVRLAVTLARGHKRAVIATAPINKQALNAAGHRFDGHTGLLAHLTQSPSSFMLLASERLSTIHVTTHVALADAVAAVTVERVRATIRAADLHFRRLGNPPRIAVASLNPHAGEAGLFGCEDRDILAPAIAAAAAEGIDVRGPCPAHTVFRHAYDGAFDVVVAQYHDQGHIPMAMVAPHTNVNVSLGLPLDRVSVDHGTAFDIAGTGRADPENMLAALRYAARLAARPRHPAFVPASRGDRHVPIAACG